MQPALRVYLTKLREEAFVEIKPGAVDTGASGNEMRLTYSAYTPPEPKKKKKFARTRFRGRDRSKAKPAVQTAAATTPAATTPAATTPAATATASTPATPAPAPKAKPTQQASNEPAVQKPGKREKIRFGQAPRESLPASEVASAAAPADANPPEPGVTVPETRVVNPDGTISGETAPVVEHKSRLSARPRVKKAKKDKSSGDDVSKPTDEELASQKVQNAPVGLAPSAAQTKTKPKGEKTRLADKPTQPDQTPAPYLGHPEEPAQTPPPAANPPAPATPPTQP